MKKMKFLFAAIAVMMFAVVQAQEEVSVKFNEAAGLVNEGKYAEAIPVLNKAIEIGLAAGPDAMPMVQDAQKLLPACYFRLGLGKAKANQLDAAGADFAKAAELGELYGDMTTMNNAKAMISRVYTMMAANAFNSKDYATAADIFAKGFAANPTDTDMGLNLAMSYCEMGQLDKGIEVYKQIIALEDRHSKYKEPATTAKEKVVYYLMLDAAKAAKEGNNDVVFKIVDDILAVDPVNPEASMLRIQTLTNMKSWDKVIEFGDAAATAQTAGVMKSNAYFLLGAAYQNKENKPKAIETYKKVLEGPNVATAKAQIVILSK